MRIYVDDDSVKGILVNLLRQAGHDVAIPAGVNLAGNDDPVHLAYAIQEKRVLLSRNHKDFLNLHNLVLAANGRHAGILMVRQDNDRTRDMTPRGVVTAIRHFESSGSSVANAYVILNHWR